MAEKRYGFIRCSTDKQNEARQLKALHDFGIPDEDIIIEKESGKLRGVEREQYSVLRKLLREGDSLVVDAIDRLGRKKSDIKSEVEYLRSKKVRLIVLSLPTTTIDPGQGQEWVLDMVTNLLIEVYASTGEPATDSEQTEPVQNMEKVEQVPQDEQAPSSLSEPEISGADTIIKVEPEQKANPESSNSKKPKQKKSKAKTK